MKKGNAKRVFALLLTVIMTLGSLTAGLTFFAGAAEDGWVHVSGTTATYEPVTIYEKATLTSNQSNRYLIAINTATAIMTNSLSAVTVTTKTSGQTDYYTSEEGTSRYTASDTYIVDENDSYSGYAWRWYNSKLRIDNTHYLRRTGETSTTLGVGENTYNTWTYSSGRLSTTVSGTTYNLRYRNSAYSLNTGTNYTTVTAYQKKTVYKKVTEAIDGGYYRYNGQTKFVVPVNSEFDENVLRNAIKVLYKEAEDSAAYDELTLSNSEITYKWDKTLNTAVKGDYTVSVYAEDTKITTLTVTVSDEGAILTDTAADPSTSAIEAQFLDKDGKASKVNDGKIATDKTVCFNKDEFNVFSSYEADEFSVALSALGQSYSIVETEETETITTSHADVIFVVDMSGSMGRYNMAGSTTPRVEGTAIALNNAINTLMENDPETRIGIVSYGNCYYPNFVYLPIDKYTLPAGDTDYVTYAKRKVSTQVDVPDANLVVTATAPDSGYMFLYFDGTSSETNDTTKARVRVDASGNCVYYPANSTSGTNVSVENNKYITFNGNALFRTGRAYYLYNNIQTTTINATSVSVTDIGTSTKSVTVNGKRFYVWRNDKSTRIRINSSNSTDSNLGNVTSSSKTANFTVDGIQYTLTWVSSTEAKVSVSKQSIPKTTKMTVSSSQSGTAQTIYTSPLLVNSKGQTMSETHYTVDNDGTYTQAGLKAAENMFGTVTDTENRVPVVVLITDGTPTFFSTDYVNVPHMNDSSKPNGNGTTAKGGDGIVDNCTNQMGYLTIRTAMSVKAAVDEMYPDYGAMFYSIGPGVDYLFGQTVLDPSAKNLEACKGNTTTNEQSGKGTPDGLRNMIIKEVGSDNLDYVDFADWSISGNMSTEQLNEGFQQIVETLKDVTRPLKTVTTTSDITAIGALKNGAAMAFTDTIGEGMKLNDAPVVRYGDKNYYSTSSSTRTEGTNKIVSYKYNHNVKEESTGKVFSLSNLTVEVTTDSDGSQVVNWYIPADLVPIIRLDTKENKYLMADPIRLVYKVGIADKTVSGTYYANSTEDGAVTSEFIPVVGNPYYYDTVEGTDGKLHSVPKTDKEIETDKTDNPTDTKDYSTNVDVIPDPTDSNKIQEVKVSLGNNGKESLQFTKLTVIKVWDDGNNITNQRPSGIQIQVLRNGEPYGDIRTITEADCEVSKDKNGNDVWTAVIDGLPVNDDYVYSVSEIAIPDHNTSYTQVPTDNKYDVDYIVTNQLINANLSYELYLVDENGNPIDTNGNKVTFENRTEMSELVTLTQYINTTTTIDLDELEKLLPEGYTIYNPDTSFTETYYGDKSSKSTASIVDDTNTTKVFYPTTASMGSGGTVTGINDYSEIKVAFAIYKIGIKPVVIVADYGKSILTYPLEKDYRGFSVSGITAEAPGEKVKTKKEVKLNNGVATLNKSVTSEIPAGDLAAKIGVNDTKIFYPETEKTTTVAYSANLRYQFTNGKIEKLEAGSSKPVTVTNGLDNEKFVVDGNYAFYRNGDTIYVVKNPVVTQETGGSTTPTTETVTEYVKVTPENSNQPIEPGEYYFTSSDFKLMVTGSSATGGGIPGSSDYTVTDNVLSTTQDGVITVEKANSANHTYYLKNSKGQYLSVNSNGVTGSDYRTVPTELKLVYSEGYLVITNSASTLHLNRYGGKDTDTTYGAWNGTTYDRGSWLVCYKKTTREVEVTPSDYYELTGKKVVATANNTKPGTSMTGDKYIDDPNYYVIANKLDNSDTGNEDGTKDPKTPNLICTLPDGTNIYGLHNYNVGGQTDTRYVYIYDDSCVNDLAHPIIKFTQAAGNTLSFKHTLENMPDENGKSLEINVYVSRWSQSGTTSRYVKVEYDEYELVSSEIPTPTPSTEDTIKMRNSLDSVVYAPFKYMSSIDRLYFYVTKDVENATDDTVDKLYSTITYIPATTVYYEDDFGGSDENGGLYIKYTGDWYTVTDDGGKTEVDAANTGTDDSSRNRQDRGEVGDGHTPYGHDSSYDGYTKFSNGTAAYVEGTVSKDANGKQQFDAKAEFTFTGTGFDLISRTDFDCGQITIQIFDHETKERIGSNVPVINKGTQDSVLYQIPVISYTGLAYDTYDVVINVNAASKLLGLGNHFYLDAIRIYDPMGTKSGDNPEFDEANEAYHTDKEANPYVASIRDFIIQIGDIGLDEKSGAVYVDTISNDYCEGGTLKFGNIRKPTYTDEQKRWRSMKEEELNTFELVGPNEEVYLTPGYGIGFKIEATKKPESVQLGIKLPKPIAEPKSTLTAQTYGHIDELTTFDVKSADEMFYDITDAVVFDTANGKYTATVILSNGLASEKINDIVSITNLKMTFDGEDAKVIPVNQNLQSVEVPLAKGDEEQEEPIVTLKASQEIYKQVFDTVYVQRIATAPNYSIENLTYDESVCDGGYLTVRFNTAKSVEFVSILDENGEQISLSDIQCTVDPTKQFTDDYQNYRTWTVKVRVLKDAGNYEFTVKTIGDEGEEVKIPVTVTPAEIAELRVSKMPAKTDFNFGEEFDFGGLEIEAIYTNDKVEKITEGFEFTESENEHGVKTITATYGDVAVEFDVNVVPVITGIRVGKAPETTEYKYESKLDAKGLELIVTYSDGSEKTVTEGFKLSKDTADTEGKMSVGVEYEGFETSFDVNVKLTFWQKIVRLVKNIITSVKDLFAKIF